MQPYFQDFSASWYKLQTVSSRRFTCGYCGADVSSNKGYALTKPIGQVGGIFICPNCRRPNFIDPSDNQFPAPSMGESVENVPEMVNDLYEEALRCTTVKCYTAATLASRKLLMHIAVEKGADEGEGFQSYVEYLEDQDYIPRSGKDWVDEIRTMGNDANHEIADITKEDTEELITFVSFLLRNIYDLPERASSFRENSE